MAIARSKVTSQSRISVPAEVRKKLGIGPGAVLQWDEEDGRVVVRRVGRYSSSDVHRALFPEGAPEPRSNEQLNASLRRHVKGKRARH